MKKLLILALAVSVIFTVAGFAQEHVTRQWNGESCASTAEEHQGNSKS